MQPLIKDDLGSSISVSSTCHLQKQPLYPYIPVYCIFGVIIRLSSWLFWEPTAHTLCLLQHICRRLLAVYDLPSWGRCELALSLLLEENAPYSLEDVVQAVRESHDREFIKRVLTKECPICLSIFPHSKVGFCTLHHQSMTHQVLTLGIY